MFQDAEQFLLDQKENMKWLHSTNELKRIEIKIFVEGETPLTELQKQKLEEETLFREAITEGKDVDAV